MPSSKDKDDIGGGNDNNKGQTTDQINRQSKKKHATNKQTTTDKQSQNWETTMSSDIGEEDVALCVAAHDDVIMTAGYTTGDLTLAGNGKEAVFSEFWQWIRWSSMTDSQRVTSGMFGRQSARTHVDS